MRNTLRKVVVPLILGTLFFPTDSSLAAGKPVTKKATVSIAVLQAMESVARLNLNSKYQSQILERLIKIHETLLSTWATDISTAGVEEQASAERKKVNLDEAWQSQISLQRSIVSKVGKQLISAEKALVLIRVDASIETSSTRASKLSAWRGTYSRTKIEYAADLNHLTETKKEIESNLQLAKDDLSRALANGESRTMGQMALDSRIAQREFNFKEWPFLRIQHKSDLALTNSFLLRALGANS